MQKKNLKFFFDKLNIKNGKFIIIGNNIYDDFLLKNDWSGMIFECNKNKCNDLMNKYIIYNDKIKIINNMISYNNNDNLDNVIDHMSNSNYHSYDFLSLNVGGLEYFIFKDINKYLPSIISINVNPGFDPYYDVELTDDISRFHIGQSLIIVCKEAKNKGYFPIYYTGNLYLIKLKYINLFTDSGFIKSIDDLYFDFLLNVNDETLYCLYKIFVIDKYFNGLWFNNNTLKNYIEK